MKTTTVLPRTQRRNRLMLGAAILAVSPAVGMLAGDLLTSERGEVPLLLAVDHLSLPAHQSLAEPIFTQSLFSDFAKPAEMAAAPKFDAAEAWPIPVRLAQPDKPEKDAEVRWFNGRPVRAVRTISMLATAYSPDERSCGESADGITASGYSVWTNGMKMAAADTDVLPFGTLISVPGYDDGNVVPVLDRGGAIKGHRLDLLYPTHQQARSFGTRTVEITVWEYADGGPSDYPPIYHWGSSVVAPEPADSAG